MVCMCEWVISSKLTTLLAAFASFIGMYWSSPIELPSRERRSPLQLFITAITEGDAPTAGARLASITNSVWSDSVPQPMPTHDDTTRYGSNPSNLFLSLLAMDYVRY